MFSCRYLTRFVSTTSEFYGWPKIHKSKILEQETNSQNNEVIDCYESEDLKLRPIISCTSCPTRSLSDIIDKILKPLLKHVKRYFKDSIHFLNKSKRTVKSGTIIVTFDVSSLYTSVSHDLGIEALTYYLRTFNHTIDSRFNIYSRGNQLYFKEQYFYF